MTTIAQHFSAISSDEADSDNARSEACRLESKINKLGTSVMTVMWNSILENFKPLA